MTYGHDVSRHIAELVGDSKFCGQIYHITNDSEIKWSDVLKIYENIINAKTNCKLKALLTDNDDGVD